MATARQVKIRLHEHAYKEAQAQADSAGMTLPELLKAVFMNQLRRPHGEEHLWREVVLQPRARGTVDSLLEWLGSRRPTAGDLAPVGGAMDARLRRALQKALTPLEARRMEKRLSGRELSDIALDEGVRKQAVHQCLQRAMPKLVRSDAFLRALLALFPDSGLDIGAIQEVLHGQGQKDRKEPGRGREPGGEHAGSPSGLGRAVQS